MFEIVFTIVLAIYIFLLFSFTLGAKKSFEKIKKKDLPSATVIVAARNEENNILRCMQSLNNLIYPKNKLEIIIVNDNSTDRTGEIINEYIKDKPKFKSVVPTGQIGNMKGKANAIANAVKISTGEIILTTDADCSVSETWAETICSYYKEDVALVCGYTNQKDSGVFSGIQSVDFIYLLTVAGGTINLGKPLSCIGNNMSYRRSVYDEIGGYENIPFSVTEDFQMLMSMHKLKKYKIIYPIDKGALVTSQPCNDVKTLYRQKKRWGVGGLDSDIVGFLVMSSAFFVNLGIVLTPFFYSPKALYLAFFKIAFDYFFLFPVHEKMGIKLKFKNFILFELYFIIYVILLPIILLFSRKINWKGRTY